MKSDDADDSACSVGVGASFLPLEAVSVLIALSRTRFTRCEY